MKKDLESRSYGWSKFHSELVAFSIIDSPFIIKVHDVFDHSSAYIIVLDMINKGALTKFIRQSGQQYSVDFCRYTLYNICMGVKALHDRNIVHKDIKSDNIYISDTGEIKIADLNLCSFLTNDAPYITKQMGSRGFAAPEVFKEPTKYDKRVDIWSIGILAYELANGTCLPRNDEFDATAQNPSAPEDAFILERTSCYSNEYQNFIDRCLKLDPDERSTIDNLLQDEFLHEAEQLKEAWINDFHQFR